MNTVEGILNKTIRFDYNSSDNFLTVRFLIYPFQQYFSKSNYSLLFNDHINTNEMQLLCSLFDGKTLHVSSVNRS